ncbi:B3/B4 domain-containing protein [Kitasatospora viridis]|uniref:DNA/RNA-binding domain of Phe-tRNA-synthetase-like protein n=1 Tax=Kitasatospora viridis TaxID=281105 RepID=A0A561UCE5_9ACTN|nr:phenylalanine--tRNA ligase beta subunit-related protein [Kitasatospora viridis]TWF97009.1 DNA/RNA-binding domain of Phe-tRNA-synthetase-like protein [Kitasatospora viridis]
MYFQHSADIWRDFPTLVPGVLLVDGVSPEAPVRDRVAALYESADARLAAGAEGEMPEIQAWRRTFSKMGLKPTQYRCASESLLRRYRKERSLPEIHPLIDLCNAVSLAFAVPIAVFDLAKVTEHLEVRYARGTESYLTFSGETEIAPEGEVVFADAADQAHARRWTNRQSGLSSIQPGTGSALIVTEALHDTAPADVERLLETLTRELSALWTVESKPAVLSAAAPRFEF